MGNLVSVIFGTLSGVLEQLGARVGGPMKFRLVLQPLMAVIVAARAGLADARAGRPAYFWAMFTDRTHRRQLAREGWKDVGKVFVAAAGMDAIYQAIVERTIHPIEALIVAALLAIVPYLLVRGPANRLAGKRK